MCTLFIVASLVLSSSVSDHFSDNFRRGIFEYNDSLDLVFLSTLLAAVAADVVTTTEVVLYVYSFCYCSWTYPKEVKNKKKPPTMEWHCSINFE